MSHLLYTAPLSDTLYWTPCKHAGKKGPSVSKRVDTLGISESRLSMYDNVSKHGQNTLEKLDPACH